MIELSAREIAEAVQGTLVGLEEGAEDSVRCTSATTDSREVVEGTLFIAKPGEVTDGHRFIGSARE